MTGNQEAMTAREEVSLPEGSERAVTYAYESSYCIDTDDESWSAWNECSLDDYMRRKDDPKWRTRAIVLVDRRGAPLSGDSRARFEALIHEFRVAVAEEMGEDEFYRTWSALMNAYDALAGEAQRPSVAGADAVVKKENGGWTVRLGDIAIGRFGFTSDEHEARCYAARVNAELNGGVAAWGCDRETRGEPKCLLGWCGSSKCSYTLKKPDEAAPRPPAAADEREVRYVHANDEAGTLHRVDAARSHPVAPAATQDDLTAAQKKRCVEIWASAESTPEAIERAMREGIAASSQLPAGQAVGEIIGGRIVWNDLCPPSGTKLGVIAPAPAGQAVAFPDCPSCGAQVTHMASPDWTNEGITAQATCGHCDYEFEVNYAVQLGVIATPAVEPWVDPDTGEQRVAPRPAAHKQPPHAAAPSQPIAPVERFLTVTTNEAGDAMFVSWQDDEHRILEIVWERGGRSDG